MPQAEAATARLGTRLRAAARRGSTTRAFLGSLTLHGVVGLALWQLEWRPAASMLARPEPLHVTLRAVPPLPAPDPAPPATPEPEAPAPLPEPVPEAQSTPQEPAQDIAEAAPEEVAPQAEPTAERTADTAAPPEQNVPAEIAPAPDISEQARLEAARNEAVARVTQALREEAARQTFTTVSAAAADEAADPDATGATVNVFEEAREAARRRGFLAHGRARSNIARRVAAICNRLTGGFSLFGIVNVCADPSVRADLFGHLRPQYMESLPLCTAQEDLQIEVEETGSGAIGSFTCVLIPRAEREAFYRRYDPDLAGWLPAEAAAAPESP